MASKKKNFWYVLVLASDGPAFVTAVHRSDKTAEWNKTDKPLELGEYWAKDLAFGLMCNFFTAYPVCIPVEMETQPYRYNIGHFEWVSDKKEKENDDNDKH